MSKSGKKFAEMAQVFEVLRVTGEDCFLVKVVVPSPPDLESIADAIDRYGAVTASCAPSRRSGWDGS